MTQYNTLNVINTLKVRIKNGTEVTLKILSNVVCGSNDYVIFLCKLFLTHTQILRVRIAFTNDSSSTIKLSKTQLHK